MRSIVSLSFLTFSILLIASCDSEHSETPSPAADKAAPVLSHEVQWQSRATVVEAVGTSRALKSVTLYPEVSGEVDAVLFKSGEEVQAGQPLVRLDARDQQLAVELAEVELADAERLYGSLQAQRGCRGGD